MELGGQKLCTVREKKQIRNNKEKKKKQEKQAGDGRNEKEALFHLLPWCFLLRNSREANVAFSGAQAMSFPSTEANLVAGVCRKSQEQAELCTSTKPSEFEPFLHKLEQNPCPGSSAMETGVYNAAGL